MMSNNRAEYGSASEWLVALKQDELWLSQLQQLGAPSADRAALREAALRKIGQTLTFEFWDSYGHRVEPVVSEVWGIAELSLPKLKIQTIGMLSMEWLEKQEKTDDRVQQGSGSQSGLTDKLTSEEAMQYWKRLQQKGFVDADCHLLPETTRKQAMYIAEVWASARNGRRLNGSGASAIWRRRNGTSSRRARCLRVLRRLTGFSRIDITG